MPSLSMFLNSGTTTITVNASIEFPVRNDWSTSGHVAATFSTASGETYSPCCSLNMFLIRSMTLSLPLWSIMPTSPVLNHRSSKPSLLASGLFNYFSNIQPPLKQISPFHTLLPSITFSGTLSDVYPSSTWSLSRMILFLFCYPTCSEQSSSILVVQWLEEFSVMPYPSTTLIPRYILKKSITSGLIGAEPTAINSILPPSLPFTGTIFSKNNLSKQPSCSQLPFWLYFFFTFE